MGRRHRGSWSVAARSVDKRGTGSVTRPHKPSPFRAVREEPARELAHPLPPRAAAMALPLLLLLLLAMFTGSEGAFCVCKPNLQQDMMQKAIDYACGKGADCAQTAQNGPCYSSQMTLVCNYIVNSYYQKNGPVGGTCDFGGVAYLTNNDPSTGSCKFGSGGGGAGGGAGAGTGGAGAGAGTGAGAGAGAGTGAGAGAGAGTGMGGTGAGAGMTTPGSTLSPPFGNAYGPSGVGTGPDYSLATAHRPVLAATFVLAFAPLALRLI